MRLKYRLKFVVLISILSLSVILPLIYEEAIATSEIDILEEIGIEVPKTKLINSEYIVRKHLISNLKVKEVSINDIYSLLLLNKTDGILCHTGKPIIPTKVYVERLPGIIPAEQIVVWIDNVRFYSRIIEKKILPCPKALPYGQVGNIDIFSTIGSMYEEDFEAYGSDDYYPGKIIETYVGYGNRETVVIVRIYPVQYNPVRNRIIVITSMRVNLAYKPVEVREGEIYSPQHVIITTNDLVDVVSKLAIFYNETLNINSKVITVEQIDKKYPPAENITMYPGFYSPLYISDKDYVYPILNATYNYTLALKIISYLRNESEHLYLHWVLLVGDALKVPPSFYYQSMTNYFYDFWNGWVPTDYFYSSPDYDLIPNYYVGRIPFSDKYSVKTIIEKIINWTMNYSLVEKEKGRRNLILSGGYPFGLFFMFGELAISQITLNNYASMFNVTLMMRTNMNYNATTVKRRFEVGNAIWYYAICHGDGNSLADLLISDGFFKFEQLISSYEILSLPYNTKVPVISSVACMDGSWDEALIYPIWLIPPSFGEAILLSGGGGIAYIGSSRVAWEIITPLVLDNGLASIKYYGAAWLHTLFVKEYNSYMGKSGWISLGQIISNSYVSYMASAGFGEIQLTTLFETGILGDPLLQMPIFPNRSSIEEIHEVKPLKYDEIIPIDIIVKGALGNVSFYGINRPALFEVEGVDGLGKVVIVRTYLYPYWGRLLGYEIVSAIDLPLIKGIGNFSFYFNKSASSFMLLKVQVGSIEARVYTTAAGVICTPEIVEEMGMVSIEAYGLDLIISPYATRTANIYVAGRYISTTTIDETGFLNWTLAIPSLKGGGYLVIVIPTSIAYGAERLVKYFTTTFNVYSMKTIDLVISAGSLYEPNQECKVHILALMDGKRINVTKLEVLLVLPFETKNLSYVQVGPGEYTIEFKSPEEEGTYILLITAEYYTEYVKAVGSTSKSITVVTGFQRLQKEIADTGGEMLNAISSIYTSLSDEIDKLASGLQSRLLSIESQVSSVKDTLMSELTSISERIGDLTNYTLALTGLSIAILVIVAYSAVRISRVKSTKS